MSKVYEGRVIDNLQGDLSLAQCTISEWEDKTQEFKKAVQGIFIDVFSHDAYARRIDVIFNEIFKELNKENE